MITLQTYRIKGKTIVIKSAITEVPLNRYGNKLVVFQKGISEPIGLLPANEMPTREDLQRSL